MPPEPAHARTQAAFHAALWEPGLPEGLTAPQPDEVARRFAVYRNNVLHSLTEALAARVPVVRALVGADFFAAMARDFITREPPRGPVLQDWGGALPGFLDRFPPVAHLPWLACVARLELLRGQASHAADAPPVPPEALALADPSGLRLALHPSVALFASPHPAVSIWQAHQPGARREPLPAGPEQALIGRQPDFTVILAPVDAGTHAVLCALQAGETLGRAARHANPTEALMLLLRHGLITATLTGETA